MASSGTAQGRTVQHADGRLIREATEAWIPGERTGSGQVRITGGYSSLFPGRDVFDGKRMFLVGDKYFSSGDGLLLDARPVLL